MGGMRDEAEKITFLPLFPRVHVNDNTVRRRRRRGSLSQPFVSKSMPLYKCTTLPSPTNKISDSLSTPSLSLPQANNACSTDPALKFEVKMNKKDISYTSPRGSLVTNTKHSSIKQNQYHFKNLTNSDSLEAPVVKDPQANTDLSLQFCNSISSKAGGEAADAKASLNNLDIQELILTECFEDASQKESLIATKRQLYGRRTLDGLNNETHKKPKTLPLHEQDISLCSMSASSNDIARVLSDKRLLKMRNYMISQQKIFAGQVFELHRLIMVQKNVAKSPNLVLKKKLSGGESSTMRKAQLLEKAGSKVRKTNTEIQKLVSGGYQDHMTTKLPLPCINKELVAPSIWPQQLLPPPPPPRNQWLVPVMSPSEGLVYKPYTGPCPSPPLSSAFMVPIYGQDSLGTTFKFPVSPQFNHNYFQPPNAKTTTLDQTNPSGQFQRWSSTSSHMTQAIPFKSQESNDSEIHGTTASSPPKKHKFGVVLPLFPTEPTDHTDEYKQKQEPMIRAIKAIPHNPISASESAARIFRMIQEERRDSDHMIS